MTPALRAYLADWLHWAENGAPDHKPYTRRFGLCFHTPLELKPELLAIFDKEYGVDSAYPFGIGPYRKRFFEHTQHLCPKRLAWVRANLEQVQA